MQQPGDVVVPAHEQLGRVAERSVLQQQLGGHMTMRREDRRLDDRAVQVPGDRSRLWIHRQQAIRIER
jgi:hypothetical protein